MSFSDAAIVMLEGLKNGLKEGADEIMAEADFLIPKDTLTALNSHRTGEVMNEGHELWIEFGYGFGGGINPKYGHPITEYIVPLHEILTANHEAPTQAKFLEKPLMAWASTAEEKLGFEIKAELFKRYGG